MEKQTRKIVSACLAGINCRWDGGSKPCPKIIKMVERGEAVPVCPEQLAGLGIPRLRSYIKEGQVFNERGINITSQFIVGAERALQIAKENNCKEAILKSRSPSCGIDKVYNENKELVSGDGIFVRLLKENNIKVIKYE